MTRYEFPGYESELFNAEDALQQWIDTQELILDDGQTELLYQYTNSDYSAEVNIRAIQAGADYAGIDLTDSPLPVLVTLPVYVSSSALEGGYLPTGDPTESTDLDSLIWELRREMRYHLDGIEDDETFLKYDTAMHVLGDVQIKGQLTEYGIFTFTIESQVYSIGILA